MEKNSAEKEVQMILLGLILTSGSFVSWLLLKDPIGFFNYLGFNSQHIGGVFAWILAGAVVLCYVYSAAKITYVRQNLFKPTKLKYLSLVAALFAGTLEEIVFRKWVIDYVEKLDYGIIMQVVDSGLTFGIIHLIWGFKNIKAGINAAISTAILGMALAIVYVLSGRSLAPCVVAHIIITALIEPGLLLAAANNKIGYLKEQA